MVKRPLFALLLIAPVLGEVLSTATSPLQLLLPWNLALFVALYGGGALLCRELTYRWGLGIGGLALLGAAYGVYEEALVDRFWFDPTYAHHTGVGSYGQVWDTNLLLAAHLTAFHSAVSICSSVLIVSWLFPRDRARAWVRPKGLAVAGIAMLLALFVMFEDHVRPPLGPTLMATAVGALLVVAAWLSQRLPRPVPISSTHYVLSDSQASRNGHGFSDHAGRHSRPRLLGLIAFSCTGAHFVLVYAVPTMGLPWPAGIAVSLTPLVIGIAAVRRWATAGPLGHDGLWVITGILGFFLVLDAFVGLGGRYDLTLSAVLMAVAMSRLHRRVRGPANSDVSEKPLTSVTVRSHQVD